MSFDISLIRTALSIGSLVVPSLNFLGISFVFFIHLIRFHVNSGFHGQRGNVENDTVPRHMSKRQRMQR